MAKQGVLDHASDVRISQVACSVAGVEIGLCSLAPMGVALHTRVPSEFFHHLGRQ